MIVELEAVKTDAEALTEIRVIIAAIKREAANRDAPELAGRVDRWAEDLQKRKVS